MTRQAMPLLVTGRAIVASVATPPSPVGLFVLARCSGTRHNAAMAMLLEQRGFATVLLDLVSSGVDHDDIDALADCVVAAIEHIASANGHRGLPIGLLGTTIGGPAALLAATRRSDLVSSVVCWSARPDLLGPRLAEVRTPTLLVAGSRDTFHLRAMHDAARQLIAPHRLAVISGATQHFDEPGALAEVAAVSGAWHLTHSRGLAGSTRAPAD